jgi:hypothetical protein
MSEVSNPDPSGKRRVWRRLTTDMEPAKPVAPLVVLLIAFIAVVSALLTWGSIDTLVTAHHQHVGDWAGSISVLAIGIFGLLTSWFAWKLGGFKELRTLRLPTALLHLVDLTAVGIHYLGVAFQNIGGAGVILTVMAAIARAPTRGVQYLASVSAGCVILGIIMRAATRARSVTIEWRIAKLRNTLKTVAKSAEAARVGLGKASTALGEIENDLKKQGQALDVQQSLNESMTETLKGDPAAIAALESSRRRDARANARHAWLGVLVGALLGAVTTVTLGAHPDTVTVWARDFATWIQGLFA